MSKLKALQDRKSALERNIEVLMSNVDKIRYDTLTSTVTGGTLSSHIGADYEDMLSDAFGQVACAMKTELEAVNAKLEAIEELLS